MDRRRSPLAFVTFSTAEQAQAAVAATNGQMFDPEKHFVLHVELARSNSHTNPTHRHFFSRGSFLPHGRMQQRGALDGPGEEELAEAVASATQSASGPPYPLPPFSTSSSMLDPSMSGEGPSYVPSTISPPRHREAGVLSEGWHLSCWYFLKEKNERNVDKRDRERRHNTRTDFLICSSEFVHCVVDCVPFLCFLDCLILLASSALLIFVHRFFVSFLLRACFLACLQRTQRSGLLAFFPPLRRRRFAPFFALKPASLVCDSIRKQASTGGERERAVYC